MKILVPVDFYKTSFAAFEYAANFGSHLSECEITLMHVINGSFNVNDVIVYSPMVDRHEAVLQRLHYFHTKYPDEMSIDMPEVPVKYEVRFGIPGFSISDFANDNKYDLIVMGTRDQHNLFDRIIGSASALTTRFAKCPVMLIHENTKFEAPEKIVFAFDKTTELDSALLQYRKINRALNAETIFLNVSKEENSQVSTAAEAEIVEAIEQAGYDINYQITSVKGKDVIESIQDFCVSEKADFLMMTHRREGVFGKLFATHTSIKMAQNFHLPVMVLHE